MRRHNGTEEAVWGELRTFLKERRLARKISQAELGRRMGVLRSMVGRWERGTVVPGATNFLAWAYELGLVVEVADAESAGGE